MAEAQPAVLEIENLVLNYGVITALLGLSLKVRQGEIVTLIRANGAGEAEDRAGREY